MERRGRLGCGWKFCKFESTIQNSKNDMKKTLTILSIIISFLALSQTKYYQDKNGKILDKKAYDKEKQYKLKDIHKQLGKDFDFEEDLALKRSNKDSIVYSFDFNMLPLELKLEKERLNKFKNKKFVIDNLEFLNPDDRQKLDLSKPTFINFWFTSCPPCIEEMPALNELKEKYNNKINFISITFNTKEQVVKFLTKYDFKFAHVPHQQKLIDSYGISGYPKSFLLDKNQNLIYIEDGLPGKENEKAYEIIMSKMETKIQKLL